MIPFSYGQQCFPRRVSRNPPSGGGFRRAQHRSYRKLQKSIVHRELPGRA